MASEQIKNVREWLTFSLSLLTVLIVPVGVLVMRNQRLEIASEVQRGYVSLETYHAGLTVVAAENAALKSQIEALNAKMDKLQITMVRVVDAVKLSNP